MINLLDNPNSQALITAVSIFKGIPETAVKKDLLICDILRNLSDSTFMPKCIFKGGTSLSKCYPGTIERFSEDIDLTYLPDESSDKQIKKQLKKLEALLAGTFTVIPIPEERSDRNISSRIEYAGTSIKLEIGSVVRSEPISVKVVKSYVQEYLENKQLTDLIAEYNLSECNVMVLDITRTFIDKLLSIKRHAIGGHLNEKVRHIYDVFRLYQHPEIQDLLNDRPRLKQIVRLTKEADVLILQKRKNYAEYNPLLPFAINEWLNELTAPIIQNRYNHLHEDLLYTDAKQDFNKALETIKRLADLMDSIDE